MENVKNYGLDFPEEKGKTPELVNTDINIGCATFVFLFIIGLVVCFCLIIITEYIVKNIR